MTEANSINAATTGIVGNTGTSFTGTAVTQYNVIVGGATTSTLANVAPSATSGVPLISQGNAANPAFGTAVVAGGGTGQTTLTNHGVLVGAGTSAITQLAVGATGTVLAGSTGADPSFTATPTVTSITFGSGTALSTYAEGTFTPSIQFGGGSTGITYLIQFGAYTKIGNRVFIDVYLSLSNKGSSTGTATVAGLPFTTANTTNPGYVAVGYSSLTLSASNTVVLLGFTNNATNGTLVQTGSGVASTVITNTMFANNSIIFFSAVYQASS